jgi:uncharacterized protein YgiM (DUF1202 family)
VKAAKGYRLTSVVKLAKVSQEPILAAEEEKEEKVMIEIDQTSKGFLRVREKPNTNSSEITKVKPGETFELLEEDKKSGWYKIVIDQDKTGWVSGEYVKLLE